MSADYTTIGHVTVDVLADGSRRPGGTALYSALQAARLGLHARVLTRGVPEEIEALLAPWQAELELQVEPAAQTTTLLTGGAGAQRRQRMLAWAGPVGLQLPATSGIAHLAPVAAELQGAVCPAGAFVGLTPQGLVRAWSEERPELSGTPASPDAIELARRSHAVVLSEQEHSSCATLIDAAASAGAVVAITAGANATTLLRRSAAPERVAVEPIAEPREDLGAGDVYAAAFFVALYERRSPADAALFASAAAAARMRGEGPGAIAHRGEIDARVAAASALD